MILDREYAQALSWGSRILGFGGGGNAGAGVDMYEAAFRIAEQKGVPLELITIEELIERHPDGGVIVTVSGVGSPASETAYTPPEYYPRLMELLGEAGCGPVIGFIACEIGASSSFEPFLPAAILGVPIVDAPCDGRAHPLGLMGSLGLEKTGACVVQVAVGGRKGEGDDAGRYVELSVRGSVENAASLVRNAAARAGGFISVARNPVDALWLQDYGAKGAYARAHATGAQFLELVRGHASLHTAADVLADLLGGRVVCLGTLASYHCDTDNALDRGQVTIRCPSCSSGSQSYTLTFFNEYMTLEDEAHRRLYTFPDGMVLLAGDLSVCSSAMLADRVGQPFALIAAKKEALILPPALRYRQGYRMVEDILQKDLISYLDDRDFFLD